jgi:hypothetical protein
LPAASPGTSPTTTPTRRTPLRPPKHRPQEEDLLRLPLNSLGAVEGLTTWRKERLPMLLTSWSVSFKTGYTIFNSFRGWCNWLLLYPHLFENQD